MILFYSANSPYARIARITLREAGLTGNVQERLAESRSPNNPVLDHSPVGRVPTLVTDTLVITETNRVYDFLKSKSVSAELSALAEPTLKVIEQEGQILGFIDGITCWVRENRRDVVGRSVFLISVETDRSARCLSYLERAAQAGGLPEFLTFRGMALAVGLDLMDFNKLVPEWKSAYPHLSDWLMQVKARETMIETAPI
ncbi:glutathione S-transferase [Aliiroseovarius sp. KMU-50]|uniref:Glutathione S-transferase n=1 Tax=Aliiroseovarius salicola TaxID=3009082 RepID=A0ABT4W2B6_9RHOB|nr:glutathione S-transferase family protein [Aliiroseovarius sp. KMU-50]MDA5093932.1 glutathione S-transferase [Aliiroseovarius sp. KMU-50]